MKMIILAFILVFITIFSKAQTTASVMSIQGSDINNLLNTSPDGLIMLSFVTNGTNLTAEAFGYNRNGSTNHHFTPISLIEETSFNKLSITFPVHLVTLKWKYDEDAGKDFDFVDGTKYYLKPIIFQIRRANFIVYTISDTPPTAMPLRNYIFAPADNPTTIFNELYRVAANNAGNFNPIPPRLVP